MIGNLSFSLTGMGNVVELGALIWQSMYPNVYPDFPCAVFWLLVWDLSFVGVGWDGVAGFLVPCEHSVAELFECFAVCGIVYYVV